MEPRHAASDHQILPADGGAGVLSAERRGGPPTPTGSFCRPDSLGGDRRSSHRPPSSLHASLAVLMEHVTRSRGRSEICPVRGIISQCVDPTVLDIARMNEWRVSHNECREQNYQSRITRSRITRAESPGLPVTSLRPNRRLRPRASSLWATLCKTAILPP
jgi:hypothetical protein